MYICLSQIIPLPFCASGISFRPDWRGKSSQQWYGGRAPGRHREISAKASKFVGFLRLPSGKHTKSYWKLPFIVDFPIENDDFPYVKLPEGTWEYLVIWVTIHVIYIYDIGNLVLEFQNSLENWLPQISWFTCGIVWKCRCVVCLMVSESYPCTHWGHDHRRMKGSSKRDPGNLT